MSDIGKAFIARSRYHLAEDFLPKIEHCLEKLSDEQIWWRANEQSNSIGNLVLHLCGNARQWIVCGLGDGTDGRDRDAEFAQREIVPRDELLSLLRRTISDVDATLKELQRVKADAQNARTDAQNARTSEALAQRKLADTEADLKRAKQEAARATHEAEQAKADANTARQAKAEAERKLANAEAARAAAEERSKASEDAAKSQRGFGGWLRRWFGRKPSNP